MRNWTMQVAKAKLSELVKLAQLEGPQEITMHGKSAAVLVSEKRSTVCPMETRSRPSCNTRRCSDWMSLNLNVIPALPGRGARRLIYR